MLNVQDPEGDVIMFDIYRVIFSGFVTFATCKLSPSHRCPYVRMLTQDFLQHTPFLLLRKPLYSAQVTELVAFTVLVNALTYPLLGHGISRLGHHLTTRRHDLHSPICFIHTQTGASINNRTSTNSTVGQIGTAKFPSPETHLAFPRHSVPLISSLLHYPFP